MIVQQPIALPYSWMISASACSKSLYTCEGSDVYTCEGSNKRLDVYMFTKDVITSFQPPGIMKDELIT